MVPCPEAVEQQVTPIIFPLAKTQRKLIGDHNLRKANGTAGPQADIGPFASTPDPPNKGNVPFNDMSNDGKRAGTENGMPTIGMRTRAMLSVID